MVSLSVVGVEEVEKDRSQNHCHRPPALTGKENVDNV